MAKKEETISLIDTFSEFKELKNIDRTTMVSVLEESFRSVIAKMFGTDENYDVIVNPDKGDFEIWRNREVVADEDLENPNLQISLSEARKIDASYEVGEEVTDEVNFAKFGRRAILNLRQTLASKILELEKEGLTEYLGTYDYYVEKKASIESGKRYLKEMSEAEKVNGAEIDFDQGTNLSPAEERALKKKKEAEERRRIREKERLESLIEELEDKIGQTEGEMCKPENLANTGLLTELDEKVKDLRVKLEEAYDNWMEL